MIDYETAVSEGWYKGTLEEFMRFRERCAFKRKPYLNKKLMRESVDEEKTSFLKLYSTALQSYYRGTAENFKDLLEKYSFGFLSTPGDRGCVS